MFFRLNTLFIRKPIYALVAVPMAKINTKLGALKPQVVPIPLVEKIFEVDVKSLLPISTSTSKITVTSRALAFLPAYSMTTRKAQGQTKQRSTS